MVGEDTHLAGVGGDVDLDDILGLVDGLCVAAISSDPSIGFRLESPSCRRLVSRAMISGIIEFVPGEEGTSSA